MTSPSQTGTSDGSPERLAAIHDRINLAAAAAGRAPGDISLIAVSKTFDAEAIVPVLEAGQRVFGENRVKESAFKWPGLRARYSGVELHLIGPLQTNKVKEALALFDVIQTLDRERLVNALVRERDAGTRLPRLFIQVNIGEEEQKAGVLPVEADAFITRCRDGLGLEIEGLMCIPPVDEDPAPHFRRLGEIARRNGLHKLSMGMSGDFEIAVAQGATHVRVGSAIFGHR